MEISAARFARLCVDSSDRMSKALARKGELVLGNCVKHGPAHDLTRTDFRDLILGWIQAGWIRSLTTPTAPSTSPGTRFCYITLVAFFGVPL